MVKRLVIVALVAGLAAAGAALWVRHQLGAPYRGFAGGETFVDIPSGSGVAGIGRVLADAGVVRHAWLFQLAARESGADRRLQAGEYRFAEAASPREIVDRLARGDVFARALTIPEGLTIREMAPLVERAGIATAAEFLAAAADASLVADLDPAAPSLEGYLFPDTYALPRRAGARNAVEAMVAGLRRVLTPAVREEAQARGLSVRALVTLASLVEKETSRDDERAVVAGVYRNRLRIRMPLQCDPTVIYALMLAGTWNGNLRRADLQVDSRYNTYRYPGLPPGPIAAPGRAAIEAALRPADVPYLYFVSRNDGSHVFASTLAEHNRNVAEWQIKFFRRR